MKSFKQYILESDNKDTSRAIQLVKSISSKIKKIPSEIKLEKTTRDRISLKQYVDDNHRIKFTQLSKDVIDDMDGYDLVEITSSRSEKDYKFNHPDVSRSVYVSVKPTGDRGRVRDDPNELLTSTFCCMKNLTIPTTLDELDKLIDEAKKLAPIVNVGYTKPQLELFDKAYTNACQAISAAIGIRKLMNGSASKGFMTGIKWSGEISKFKRNAYGMKDFNSSDIVLKRGDTYYGISLKKKSSSTSQDPTILNKSFTSLLNGDEFTSVVVDLNEKRDLFYTKVIKKAMGDDILDGDPHNVTSTNWQSFMNGGKRGTRNKLGNDYVNKSLKSSSSFFKSIDEIIKSNDELIASELVELILKMDLKELKQHSFEFSLVTGIGKYLKTKGPVIEDADVKDLDTVLEVMDELFSKGKPSMKPNKSKKQAFEVGSGAAKLFYILEIGGTPIIEIELRYKGTFTSQPQFQAVLTKEFKDMFHK